jgi:hypothetical protein
MRLTAESLSDPLSDPYGNARKELKLQGKRGEKNQFSSLFFVVLRI